MAKSPESAALSRYCPERNLHCAYAGLPALAVLLHGGEVERRCRLHLDPSATALASGGYCGSARRSAPSPGSRETVENLLAWSACDPDPVNWLPACIRAGDQVFHIQQHAKIAAELGAILMCDAGKLLQAQLAFNQPFRQAFSTPAAISAFSARGPRRSSRETRASTRSFAGPVNSRSTTSSPCEAATRCAAIRISSSFTAICVEARPLAAFNLGAPGRNQRPYSGRNLPQIKSGL